MMLEKLEEIAVDFRRAEASYDHTIRVCTAAGCLSAESDAVKSAFEKGNQRRSQNARSKELAVWVLCSRGPLVAVDSRRGEVLYGDVSTEDAHSIVASLQAEPVARLRIDTDTPFFAN